MWHEWERRDNAQGFDGKARSKETTPRDLGLDVRMGSEWGLGILAEGV
jgi:hypothetical protein